MWLSKISKSLRLLVWRATEYFVDKKTTNSQIKRHCFQNKTKFSGIYICWWIIEWRFNWICGEQNIFRQEKTVTMKILLLFILSFLVSSNGNDDERYENSEERNSLIDGDLLWFCFEWKSDASLFLAEKMEYILNHMRVRPWPLVWMIIWMGLCFKQIPGCLRFYQWNFQISMRKSRMWVDRKFISFFQYNSEYSN